MLLVALDRLPTIEHSIVTLDKLRAEVKDGHLIAFAAVGIDDGDRAYGYCGTSRPVSRLRMQGAIAQLMQEFASGAIG